MGTLSAEREQEITQILAPWLRAKVENGLLKIWLSDQAPEYPEIRREDPECRYCILQRKEGCTGQGGQDCKKGKRPW